MSTVASENVSNVPADTAAVTKAPIADPTSADAPGVVPKPDEVVPPVGDGAKEEEKVADLGEPKEAPKDAPKEDAPKDDAPKDDTKDEAPKDEEAAKKPADEPTGDDADKKREHDGKPTEDEPAAKKPSPDKK